MHTVVIFLPQSEAVSKLLDDKLLQVLLDTAACPRYDAIDGVLLGVAIGSISAGDRL